MALATKSFTGPAILALVLYFFLWVPGFIANILFYREAREVRRATGRTPAGMGLLSFMLWAPIVFWVLLILIVAAN
jgi:hypothetical protein